MECGVQKAGLHFLLPEKVCGNWESLRFFKPRGESSLLFISCCSHTKELWIHPNLEKKRMAVLSLKHLAANCRDTYYVWFIKTFITLGTKKPCTDGACHLASRRRKTKFYSATTLKLNSRWSAATYFTIILNVRTNTSVAANPTSLPPLHLFSKWALTAHSRINSCKESWDVLILIMNMRLIM